MTALTRRDRVMIEAALSCLRRKAPKRRHASRSIEAACSVLLQGDEVSPDETAAIPLTWTIYEAVDACRSVDAKLLRGRLALLLRAILRADRGDVGPMECEGCQDRETWGNERPCRECWLEAWQERGALLGDDERPWYRRVRFAPLWDVAGRR